MPVIYSEFNPAQKTPNWHYVYFLLAAFDVLIVIVTLYSNDRLVGMYTRSLSSADAIATLRGVAAEVNAPAKDVFESRDAVAERERMQERLLGFSISLQKLREMTAVSDEDTGRVKAGMALMVADAVKIFDFYEAGDEAKAAELLSSMDRRYETLNKAISDMGKHKRQREVAEAASLERWQIAIGLFVLLMVCGAAYYGHKLKLQIRAFEEEKRRYTDELEAARNAALAAAQAKANFLASMSHEIRTPLNGVIGMADLLLHSELTEEQRDYADTLRRSGDALLMIINDILDFSKIDAGKLETESLVFDLHNLVEEVVELLGAAARRKQIELTGIVHEDVPSQLSGDPNRLRQILTNLVGNAVKFTSQGRVAVSIRLLEARSHDVQLVFEVEDSGIGIASDWNCLRSP
jgi:signal transduction histidine kinase